MKRMMLLGLLALSMFAIEMPKTADAGVSYWCPSYTWYCSRNSQCRGYCGPGTPPEWEICSQGCCACLG